MATVSLFSALPGCMAPYPGIGKPFFKISLAQWSLHRQLRSGKLKVLDFAEKTKRDFDIHAVEYVNQFFIDKARDKKFLASLKKRADDQGVQSLLIMVDAEGELGNPDAVQRMRAVANHFKWVEAAHYLGCHSIRVNAAGKGEAGEVARAAIDGLRHLCEFAEDYALDVIIENHGGYSSNGRWLADVIRQVDKPNCGSLPDFGNFAGYDRYRGVEELIGYARGVSAKSFAFDAAGWETETDYLRMLRIIKNAGYRGYIGIEYEGEDNDEDKGILATKNLLLRAGEQLDA